MNIVNEDYLETNKTYTPEQLRAIKKALSIQEQIKQGGRDLRHLLRNNGLSILDLHKYDRDGIFEKTHINCKDQTTGFKSKLLDILSGWKSLLPPGVPK